LALPKNKKPKIILSGGGTGGHLYPALAIAEALKRLSPESEILFVGALGKIEMEKVPSLGYKIIGLDIRGFQRSFSVENLKFPYRLIKSYFKSRSILRNFRPDVVIGVGGYASGPLLMAAGGMHIPSFIQEQNSFPGKTNLYLSKKAKRIFVAYPGMERFFPAGKIELTGNPVRSNLMDFQNGDPKAYTQWGFTQGVPTLLVMGGSGGARKINEAILNHLSLIQESGIQLIWQTGKNYFKSVEHGILEFLGGKENSKWIIRPFLDEMNQAYSVADLVISRAGAGTISELTLVSKPCILVPSPNVAEDHQTKNAQALVESQAGILVRDAEAANELVPLALETVFNKEKLHSLSKNIHALAFPNAAENIATEILHTALNPKES